MIIISDKIICPHEGRETRLSGFLVELLILVGYFCANFGRTATQIVCQTASHLELNSLSVSHFQGTNHASAASCASCITNHFSFIVVKSFDLQKAGGSPIFVE